MLSSPDLLSGVRSTTHVIATTCHRKRGALLTKGNNSTTSTRRLTNRFIGHFCFSHPNVPSVTLAASASVLPTVNGSCNFADLFTERIRTRNYGKSIFVNVSASNGSPGVVRTLGRYGGGKMTGVNLAKRGPYSVSTLYSVYVGIPSTYAPHVRRSRVVVKRVVYTVIRRRLFKAGAR